MLKKKDIIIIVAVLLLAAAAYGVMTLTRQGQTISGMVEIYAGGELYASVPLAEEQEITVVQPGGESNTVAIKDGGVYMAHASCKNQLCLQQGTVTIENWTTRAMGRSIVCLPNSVLVELALDEGERALIDPEAPDI